ncbi:MAG: tRNA (adenosine(37)-N6)-dimethylallyltransferase MiaA [Oligoflexales bacterium]
MIESKTIAIVGPTASGKSQLALALARELNGEIVSCDSVQVYRGFDIGSAKPTLDEQHSIVHHMIDILDPQEKMDAAVYARSAQQAIANVKAKGKVPILVGGTGLYFRALCGEKFHDLPTDLNLKIELSQKNCETLYDELSQSDPERAQKIHKNDHFRLVRAVEIFRLTQMKMTDLTAEVKKENLDFFTWALIPDRKCLHQRIENRSVEMLRGGLVEEVENLLEKKCPEDAWPFQSIGYKQVLNWIQGGKCESFDQLSEKIMIATRQYAKRQCTWFRNYRRIEEETLSQRVDIIRKTVVF